jgi:hypothetical protein
MVGFLCSRKGAVLGKVLGQNRSLHMGKRNHETRPLIEGERFIIYLECFFLMKSYYTMPGHRGQGETT